MRLIPCKTRCFAICELGGRSLASLPALAGLLPVFVLWEAEQSSLGEPGGGWLCKVAGLREELEGWGGDSPAPRLWGSVKVLRERQQVSEGRGW